MVDNRKGIITDIQRFSVHDGKGIRTIVFLKGCPLRCQWCQNPETNDVKREIAFFADKCIGCGLCRNACKRGSINEDFSIDRRSCVVCGGCADVCPSKSKQIIGKEQSAEEIFEIVMRDEAFYRATGGGITLSGGEPTLQAEFTKELFSLAKKNNISTVLETCGYCDEKTMIDTVQDVDMVYFDVKHADTDVHMRLTGVGNELILENLAAIRRNNKEVVIRVPFIPGKNDDLDNISEIGKIAKRNMVSEIHILPFHQLGQGKWYALNKEYICDEVKIPDEEKLQRVKSVLNKQGLTVNIGGSGE